MQNNPIELKLTPPAIPFALTGFTPVSAAVGAEVTITGTSFVADPTKMKVTFANNVQAQIMSATATSLVVKVPDGAVSGKITVTNLNTNESKTSVADFTVMATPVGLSVNSFAPTSGLVGAEVVITGTGFDSDLSKVQVKFGDVPALIVSGTATSLTVKVPTGAISSKIIVTNLTGNVSQTSSIDFTVETPTLPLTISSISPATGVIGDKVTILGTGFDSDLFHMVVTFNNNVAAEIVSATSTQLVLKVPDGAKTGTINVLNSLTNATVSSASQFTVQTSTPTTNAWKQRSLPTSFVVNAITFGAQKFVVVGAGKGIYTSDDGITWVTQSTANPNLAELKSITFDGTQFIAVGGTAFGNSAPPLILTSPDGVTWT
ncbi:MAG TPA: IPT/TIG domain-containing protein, partial [Agitococcus sp.]|nr:IPT/TIG domain-containing protein [Agitococcus sp.]